MSGNWKVMTTKAESEPWWFFKDWEQSIIASKSFTDQAAAAAYYRERYATMQAEFQHMKIKQTTIAAFWNEGEAVYCESCDDDLQLYYGLMIFENDQPFTEASVFEDGDGCGNGQ